MFKNKFTAIVDCLKAEKNISHAGLLMLSSQEHPINILTVFKLCEQIISTSPSVCGAAPCCGRLDFVPDARGEQGRLGLRTAEVNCVR